MDASQSQPPPAALDASEDTIAVQTPPLAQSLAAMRAEIEALLDDATRKELMDTATTLMRLGNKRPKWVEPRRRKIRAIVEKNSHIVVLYNKYARTHAQREKRLTYRLPVFDELEAQVRAAKERMRDDENMEMGQDEEDDMDMNEATEVHALAEEQEDGTLALEVVETRKENAQTGSAKDKKVETGSEEEDTMISQHRIDEAAHAQHERMKEVAAEQVTPERATTIVAANAQRQNVDMTLAENHITEPTVTIAEPAQQAQAAVRAAVELEHNSGLEFRQQVVSCEIVPATIEPASVASAFPNTQKFVAVALGPETRSQPQIQQDTNGTTPCAVIQDAVVKQLPVNQPILKPNELVAPVVNPEAFPVSRIQDVQALRYPRAKAVAVWAHRDARGEVIQVTVDMQDGPVNHLIINDARIITAFGLREGNDFITVHEPYLRHNETFDIRIFPNQRVRDMRAFIVGEMVSARHAYLYWLELRGSADPKGAPWAQEAKRIAVQVGRRAPDVWREIDGYWQLEHGSGGRMYRENRMKYLGEDPVFHESIAPEKKKMAKNMWG